MEKFTRDIIFEGINEEIRETLKELGYTDVEYLENFCTENNFELIIKTISYKSHEETCEVGWNDAETSENISDALLSLYDYNYTDDNDLIYDIYITNGIKRIFVKTLGIKDYMGLVIVNRYGIEIDPCGNEFADCVIKKVNESLNNNNLQSTKIYKSIFGAENTENMDDKEYNKKFDCLVEEVLKSVKKYMLSESEQRFEHFVSCYFFYEIPAVRNCYIDDICDVLDYEDR